MRLILVATATVLLHTGCHTALEREMICLGTLMPELGYALQKEEALRSQWRVAHNAVYEARLRDPARNLWLAPFGSGRSHRSRHALS